MNRVTGTCAALCCVCLLVAGVQAAAQTGAGAADPSASYFARERVLAIEVEMAPENWETLRAQTRTLGDILGGADCLAQPAADHILLVSGRGDGGRGSP